MTATKKNLWTIAFITLAFLAIQKRGFAIPFIGTSGTVVSKDASTQIV